MLKTTSSEEKKALTVVNHVLLALDNHQKIYNNSGEVIISAKWPRSDKEH